MFLTTETSIPKRYQPIRIVHASATKSGQFATEKAIVKYTEEAVETALGKIALKADELRADGVIGVQICVSPPSGLMCVTILGTAIKFVP